MLRCGAHFKSELSRNYRE